MLFQFDLFPLDNPFVPQADPAPEKAEDAEGTPLAKARRSGGWQISDHCCRHCLGRVLQRVSRGEVLAVRCAECGKAEDGPVQSLCACGADCGDLGYALECYKNPHVSKEIPHEVMVRERPIEKREKDMTPARPVKLPGY
jgi:hypothetical protein